MLKSVLFNLHIIIVIVLLSLCDVIKGNVIMRDSYDEGNLSTNAICKDDFCGSHSYKDILKKYKGLFHTMEEILSVNTLYTGNTASKVIQTSNQNTEPTMDLLDDNSICCSTSTRHIANTTIENIFGELKYVIHLPDDDPPNYQYIPHGECVRTGTCTGRCVIESKIVTLLVLDGLSNLSFDLFAIPGYCTCKNIHT